MEVLERAAHGGIALVVVTRPRQRAEVGEHRQQALVLGRVVADRLRTGGVAVEAQHEPLEAAHGVEPGAAASAANAIRSPAATVGGPSPPSSSSSWSSGAWAGTWTLGPASTRRTRPRNGAISDVSIFMLSSTATTSPAWTSSPSATGIDTTTAGDRLRTMPPSSRATRCGTPSTSTSSSGPCTEVMVRWWAPARTSRRSWRPTCCVSTSTATPSTRIR